MSCRVNYCVVGGQPCHRVYLKCKIFIFCSDAENSRLQSQLQSIQNEAAQASKNLEETGGRYRSAVAKLAEIEELNIK